MEETYVVIVPTKGEIRIEPFRANDSYNQLKDAVGGWIEGAIIPPIPSSPKYSIDCYVNEEGLLIDLPLNPRLTKFVSTKFPDQVLVGDAIFVGHDEEGETKGLIREDAEGVKHKILSLWEDASVRNEWCIFERKGIVIPRSHQSVCGFGVYS